jgi:hypothetical protein
MLISVEYYSYNNKDFRTHVPCESMEVAEILKEGLEKLDHIYGVQIILLKEKDI